MKILSIPVRNVCYMQMGYFRLRVPEEFDINTVKGKQFLYGLFMTAVEDDNRMFKVDYQVMRPIDSEIVTDYLPEGVEGKADFEVREQADGYSLAVLETGAVYVRPQEEIEYEYQQKQLELDNDETT